MAKKPQPKAASAHGPRILAMFHHGKGRLENRHFHTLAWVERACNNGVPQEPIALHLIYNDDNRIVHERRPAEELQYLEASGGSSTAAEFEEYLRTKLVANGGSPGAYEFLRVDKPVVEVVASPEKQQDINELYTRAARLLDVPEAELRKKYGHLNPGLQAMNLRNRLRGKGHNV